MYLKVPSAKFTYKDDTPYSYEASRENVGGLNIGLGAKYVVPDTPFTVGLSFHATQIGRANILTNDTAASTQTVKKTEDPVKMTLHIAPQYVLDGTTIGVDMGFYFTTESKLSQSGSGYTTDADKFEGKLQKDSEAQYGFSVFAKRGFGKATLQAGIAVQTPVLLTANNASYEIAADTHSPYNASNTVPIPGVMAADTTSPFPFLSASASNPA